LQGRRLDLLSCKSLECKDLFEEPAKGGSLRGKDSHLVIRKEGELFEGKRWVSPRKSEPCIDSERRLWVRVPPPAPGRILCREHTNLRGFSKGEGFSRVVLFSDILLYCMFWHVGMPT